MTPGQRTLTAADWARLQEVFDAASQLPPERRPALLDRECAGQTMLRSQVESLLGSLEGESVIEPAVRGAVTGVAPIEGERIGPYAVIRVLGHGGMGVVYLASRADDAFQKVVAIKLLRLGWLDDDMRRRFQLERQILARLEHPNIARLLDGGTVEGAPYVVMEYVDGAPMDQYCREHGLSVAERLRLFRQLCEAVAYAHRNLIVHRDIKPGNVLVREGVAKLLDFGIAKLVEPDGTSVAMALTEAGDRLMTPDYASPEQVRGEPITTASDIYSLGVLLYELLTGERPFRAAGLTAGQIERAICTEEPPKPSTRAPRRGLDGDLDRIVLKAMHKEPARRYPSAAELSADIERYLAGFPVSARQDSWGYRARKFVRRHRVATTVAALVFSLVLALGIGMAILAQRATREARASAQTTDFLVDLFNSSDPNQTKGESVTVRELLDRGAARLETQLKDDPSVQARLFDTVGGIYDTIGVWPRAEELIKKALALRRTRLPRDDMALANTLHELGSISNDLDEFDQAERSYREALSLYRKKLGDRDAKVAQSLDDLGTILFQEGRRSEAESLFRQSWDLNVKALGAGNEESLRAMNNLAVVLFARGDAAGAEPLRREQLKLSIQSAGPAAEPTIYGWHNLGAILDALGRFREAESALRQAAAIQVKLYGAGHAETAQTYALLAGVLTRMGRLDEAKTMASDALANTLKAVGPKNLHTAFAQDSLASVLLATGNAAEARRLFQASSETRAAILGAGHEQSAGSLMNLGRVDLATGQLPAARREFQQALDLRQREFGNDSVFVGESQVALAETLMAAGDFTGAEPIARAGLAALRSGYPKGHLAIGEAERALGWSLVKQNRLADSRPLLQDAYAIAKNVYGAANPESARAAVRLAACLAALRDETGAQALISSAEPVLSHSNDPTPRLEREILRGLERGAADK
jgi:serine/threonine-protein kinase